jgi:hypothetical protein
MSPEQIKSKLAPTLTGPRLMPDAEAMQIRLELNCICGAIIEPSIYTDSGLIKIIVNPCAKCGGRLEDR